MDIEYKGANCVVLSTKNQSVVTDPKLSLDGLKDVVVKNALVLATQHRLATEPSEGVLIVDGPGEYETKHFAIRGVAAERLIDHDKSKQATMYRLEIGGVAVAVIGHVATPITEDQLEQLGIIDIAIVPVGGSGYTLDAHQAVSVVRELNPKVVIPTHYADKAISYEVPQMELEAFIKELGAEHEEMPKFKIKNGVLPDVLTVIELTRVA
jgi:L-ascorbate metabolism protein UlaG (beta-lactamase superfamily)